MVDDIEQRNALDDLMASRTKDVQQENVFDDLMANWREEQRSRFISKDLPNMNRFCDWLFETIVISVYDSFFGNYISIVLLSFIVCNSQSQRLFI